MRRLGRCYYVGVTAAGKPYCMKRIAGKWRKFCKCPKSVSRRMARDPYAAWK